VAPVGPVFFDTSVLVAGLIELRPAPDPAQQLLTEVAEGRLETAQTAWHCCLEFFAVSTRLPKPYRLSPQDALDLLAEEILARFDVHHLSADQRRSFLTSIAQGQVSGGRVYDAHIAEVAVRAEARIVVTENLRHFVSLEGRGVAVMAPASLLRQLGTPGTSDT
jgi:predicted nucleic acid-binding protein